MPILDPHSVEFISRSAEQTRRVGMRLGALVDGGDVVCLVGDLGSGKTTFVQGLAAGWGSLDPVTSPTFVLVNLYRRPEGARLYHLDAYRLSGASEAVDLDLDAMLESGLLVIEWAERIQRALPREHLWISLRWINPQQRDLIFSARGVRYQSLLAKLRQRLYGAL
ncbi:MAG TPA: tRNA (adenosine(37)-N6)-threonylcarbamoyltransferase complex ATPase subunit type 1 TsaE [Anaerolineales bacterium]|jgi:tRNA threonylcarbamoyladenosine biosynthesis protein TsaE|nr:tRNA (adenosine(37)-N6)-threonylcarbamoyltransferase complex ATPase subunit type 1 TsaE [Anaerolineales bacterium]